MNSRLITSCYQSGCYWMCGRPQSVPRRFDIAMQIVSSTRVTSVYVRAPRHLCCGSLHARLDVQLMWLMAADARPVSVRNDLKIGGRTLNIIKLAIDERSNAPNRRFSAQRLNWARRRRERAAKALHASTAPLCEVGFLLGTRDEQVTYTKHHRLSCIRERRRVHHKSSNWGTRLLDYVIRLLD